MRKRKETKISTTCTLKLNIEDKTFYGTKRKMDEVVAIDKIFLFGGF